MSESDLSKRRFKNWVILNLISRIYEMCWEERQHISCMSASMEDHIITRDLKAWITHMDRFYVSYYPSISSLRPRHVLKMNISENPLRISTDCGGWGT